MNFRIIDPYDPGDYDGGWQYRMTKRNSTPGVRVGACGAEKCGTGCADPMNCKRPLGVGGTST